MSELADKRKEQFARLLAAGMAQAEAYVKAGFRAADRSNASKAARAEDVIIRVEEIRAEETVRQARLKQERGDLSGHEELKRAAAGAAASGNWSAAVTAYKALGEADGSLAEIGPDKANVSDERLALSILPKVQAAVAAAGIPRPLVDAVAADIIRRLLGLPEERWAALGLPPVTVRRSNGAIA